MAMATGFAIFEHGAKASGMAGAFAATADDPSAIFYNVAGIAYQRKMAALTGGVVITFANQFEGAPDDPLTSGQRAFYERHTFVLPHTYAIIPIGENATIGIGSFTAFGLRTHWEDANRFAGRFIAQDTNLKSASFNPAFAWKTSSGRFAVGLGAEYRRSHIQLERNSAAVNPFTQRVVDVVHTQLDSGGGSEWDSAWGFNVGTIFQLSDTCRIGLSHRSKMTIDYSGQATFTQISTGNAQLDAIIRTTAIPPNQKFKTSIDFPAFTHLGFGTTWVPNWQIELDIVHSSWSNFKALDVEFAQTPAANLHVKQNWEDSISYRIGGNRKINDSWNINLGALYDETPQPVEAVGPLLPDANRVGITFGVGFHSGHWTLEASNLVLHLMDRDTLGRNQDNFNGVYQTTANLLSLSLGYTF